MKHSNNYFVTTNSKRIRESGGPQAQKIPGVARALFLPLFSYIPE